MQPFDADAYARIRLGVLLLELLCEDVHLRARILQCEMGIETGDDAQTVSDFAIGHEARVPLVHERLERQEELDLIAAGWELELRWHHADDRA